MIVWIKRRVGPFDTWQQAVQLNEGDRVVVFDPENNNELINCSRAFFEKEVEAERIVLGKEHP